MADCTPAASVAPDAGTVGVDDDAVAAPLFAESRNETSGWAGAQGVVVAGRAWNGAVHAWPEVRAAVARPLGSDEPDESATGASPPARGVASDGVVVATVAVVVDVGVEGGVEVPAAGSLVAGAP